MVVGPFGHNGLTAMLLQEHPTQSSQIGRALSLLQFQGVNTAQAQELGREFARRHRSMLHPSLPSHCGRSNQHGVSLV